MGDTPGRTLELLGLLQGRPTWLGSELAARLGVTERTVRRDVDRLRRLGFPVEAVPGRYGGYGLGRGASVPPLLLNDDETVAVAVGLRAAVDGTIEGLEETAVSALAKLDKLLPVRLATRIRAVHDSTASMSRETGKATSVSAAQLLLLAHACSNTERVRFEYVDKGGRASRRVVEPLQVVRMGPRWYLAARDTERQDWRTFRLDRIRNAENVKTRFELEDPPDAVELIASGMAALPYPVTARIAMPLPVEEAARVVYRPVALYAGGPGTTIIELGSTSLERMVGYVAGLRPACRVIDPPALREALAAHARAVAEANAGGG